MTGWIFHVDMDMFLAAVEIQRRPELAGRPLIVGGRGDPNERTVVSTASYEAREFGVRSGMPLRIAMRKCPDAILLPVDFPVYEAASERVMTALRGYPGAVVQVLGWDEAFVGVESDDPVATARDLQRTVFEATGLHCSVGVGDTTTRAKIATDFDKPRGVFCLTHDNWFEVMGDRPVKALWGIGPRIAERLNGLGIETVRQLAASSDEPLIGEFGPNTGPHIGRLGRGLGATQVDDTPWAARAHGRETTFQQDLTSHEEIDQALRTLAAQVIDDLLAEDRPCQRVHLKVRFAPFFTFTRSRKLAEPTFDIDTIADTAHALLTALDDTRPIRLLGIRGEMVPPEGGY